MNKNYQERIELALQYIDSHINEQIKIIDIAHACHFSHFHFHRIFTGIMKETPNDYVSRRRLERAIHKLVYEKELSITDIALANNFSSTANFSKAIKNYFGFSPSEIRHPDKIKNSKIGKLLSKYGKDFHPLDLYPYLGVDQATHRLKVKDIKMNVEIKELPAQHVCVLASSRGYELSSILETWDQIILWAQGHNITDKEQQRYAFCYSNPVVTPIDKCRYEAAIVIPSELSVLPPFKVSTIPQGKYAVLYYKGAQEKTTEAHLSLFGEWFPQSGFEPDHFPMIEKYLNDVREDGYVEMEIYIKIKTLS